MKGVTLESDNIARFPDAPTERGVKHLKELIHCMQEGYEAYLLLVIQMKGVERFEPNWETHREFGETLQEAERAGVHILAYDCLVEPDRMEIRIQYLYVLPLTGNKNHSCPIQHKYPYFIEI